MAVEIPLKWLDGGRGFNDSHKILATTVTIKQVVDSLADDAANLFQIVQDVADKLDLDAGVTDTNYRATADAVATGPLTTKET